MKLLTTQFLTCAVRSCKTSPASFPLHFRDASLLHTDIEFNSLFITNILPRLEWDALVVTAQELGLSAMLPSTNPVDAMLQSQEQAETETERDEQGNENGKGMEENSAVVDEQVLKKMHKLLMETSVSEGKLVCGNCGFEYAIKEGVGNFLLPPHLV